MRLAEGMRQEKSIQKTKKKEKNTNVYRFKKELKSSIQTARKALSSIAL